jgi:hypothetical protein
MQHLYSYLIEKQGYLDYGDFVNDIFAQIKPNREFMKKMWKAIINKTKLPDFEILVESDNYPYWLEKLYVKSYPLGISNAGVDTDLVFLNKDKTKVESATIYLHNKFIKNMKPRIETVVNGGYNEDLTDDVLDTLQNMAFTLKDITKPVISHEIKHIFDILIGNSKQNKKLLNSFDGNSYVDIDYDNPELSKSTYIEALSEISYFLNTTEESAHKQQLIEHIKAGDISRKELEELLYKIDKSTINEKEHLSAKYCDSFDNCGVISNFLGTFVSIRYAYKTIDDLSNESASELCTIIRQYKVGEKVLGKKFNGSTHKDLKMFYNKSFDKFKKYIVDMIKIAAKHL